jgi:adenine deaminase
MTLTEKIRVARGKSPSDLLLTNARIVNVFTGEIEDGNIAVSDGMIVGTKPCPAVETIDLKGRYVSPGLIDAHVHIESSMADITGFARAVVPHGTTTVVADPHEIANVLGIKGIEYMLQTSKNQPMTIYFGLPSCVPATDLETSGARLSAEDLAPFMNLKNVAVLGEMMNFPGVIHGDPVVLSKMEMARKAGKRIDGHSPGLTGHDLNAYLVAGAASDHECTTEKEAWEKLSAGMFIMIREGTGARNLHDLLPVLNLRTASRIMWCTDDRHPRELVHEGSIDSMVREAVRCGVDPVTAIRTGTLSPADYFGFHHLGAIAPGRLANLVVFSDLQHFCAEMVYHQGKLVAKDGEMLPEIPKPAAIAVENSMNVDIFALDFKIPCKGKRARVIEIVPGQIVTRQVVKEISCKDGSVLADTDEDILKMAVVERHTGSGNIGKGLVTGFGLKTGALASSVAHDSHNIIVVGTQDSDMKSAVEQVVKMGGGLAVVDGDQIVETLPLPVAGLMSSEAVKTIQKQMDKLLTISHNIGCRLDDPFMILSFLALPVIPELKLTDKGLVDVTAFKLVSLFK